MTQWGGRRKRTAAIVAGIGSTALLVWASSGSALKLADGRAPEPAPRLPVVPPSVPPVRLPPSGKPPLPPLEGGWKLPSFDLHQPARVIALVLVTLAVVLLTHRVWRNWQQRWRPPAAPDPHAVRLAVEPPTVVDSLSQRRARHLDALSSGVPRNAIVACWLDLEESVRASGIPADPALTSAELTQRVLISLDVDPQPVLDLARLYREARFSTHDLGEHHRESAVRAVQQFHADLAGHPVSATRLTSDGRS